MLLQNRNRIFEHTKACWILLSIKIMVKPAILSQILPKTTLVLIAMFRPLFNYPNH